MIKCKNLMKIRSNNPYNISETYIPCGHCSECRKIQKNEWTTRLKSEIEYYHNVKHYRVGFITLTYDERHLPFIPQKFFKDGEYRKIPCFSYEDIQRFINTIRCYFWRELGLKNAFRYFITSEYGEKKHRPHYHAIILYTPAVTPMTMYNIVQDAWCGTHEVIPQNKKNKKLQRQMHGIIAPYETFIPRDTYACGAYVAKYVCKDLEFQETAGDGTFDHLDRRSKNHLRHFMPFHRQSLGFGSCALKGKTDEELVQMYREGMEFTGEARKVNMPRYLKERLLFRIQKTYDIKTHKHHYIKKYSKWFMEFRSEVFDDKIMKTRNHLLQLASKEYWELHPLYDDAATAQALAHCKLIIDYLNQTVGLYDASIFLANYFGVNYSNCYISPYPEDVYIARYDPCADLTMLEHMDKDYYDTMTQLFTYLKSYEHLQARKARSDQEAFIEEMRSFYLK